jgi:glutamate-ammonia-ligase adenylyltransferase
LLDQIAFQERLLQGLPAGIQSRIQILLAGSADPKAALSFLDALALRHPEAFSRMVHSPICLQYLISIFSYSHFLSEEVLQHPEWVEQLPVSGVMHRSLAQDEFIDRLEVVPGVPSALVLAQFRRQQILRILLRDVMGYATLSEVTAELSALAGAILDVSLRGVCRELRERHGVTQPASGFAVLALGKLGGEELNYSSDIDLMFLYRANGPAGPFTSKEFYKKVANAYTDLLSTYTAEGLCYRVDLRLRPDGRLGEVCLSLDGMKYYYQNRARDWELQMLIKARAAAGDRSLARELLDFVDPMIYSTTLDFNAVESVSATRERIHEKLAARRAGRGLDVKLAPGGIRDIEFLVQCLQRLHGGREPWVRHGGTLLALSRLFDKELLSDSEYSRLSSAYTFLRYVEHRLQAEEDRQTHSLPEQPERMEVLARRLPRECLGDERTADRLIRELNRHLEEVQEIYKRVIHAQRPNYYTAVNVSLSEDSVELMSAAPEPPPSNLVRFLDEKAPRLAGQIARANLRRGTLPLEHFLERIDTQPETLGRLDSDPVLTGYLLDLAEHSHYLAEKLIRRPELLEELHALRHAPEVIRDYGQMARELEDHGDLRRFFLRHAFHLQAQSICLQTPIFETLERMSSLADATIAAAYRMAKADVAATVNVPGDMMVVALGRLGMREFDLASDADLIFVVRDDDHSREGFWTRVAERLIHILTAYTGEGVMFAVDTRLRPNGREGALVQFESGFKDYFAHQAEAWEGITYMKSRVVAGDIERGTKFLNELQKLDWRRYGQSGRSKAQLRQMRARLEKEQGLDNPLKAGPGGYYDIDFALMYLRLKGAGIFFKVLNTPERIDVIEQMGHLERSDAEFLRDAAIFYRALDHGLRVLSGHTEGSLPRQAAVLEMVTDLVSRWTPEHLHDQELPVELAQIQRRTREFFDRIFG